MISYLIKNKKAKKGAYMRKCEGIYSLIGKVNHKSAIYGFELLKEKNSSSKTDATDHPFK